MPIVNEISPSRIWLRRGKVFSHPARWLVDSTGLTPRDVCDKLVLSYLIEEWNKHFQVVIPDGNLVNVNASLLKNGFSRRKSIFKEKCKTWNEPHTLSLLKVNIPVVPSFDSDSDLSQINVDQPS